ncbi:ATP-binding protein [Macrococcus equi]|uniref:ATP-binding protein n=1 Tax=Macrococcus equi TaxID=3395462 RepID=UPI0039BE26F0
MLEKIITEESDTRLRNKKERYRKAANLSVINARLENLIYSPKRKLKSETIEQLSTNDYILSNNNLIIQGATGTSKSYIACALINHAIDNGYNGLFFKMTDLLSKL